MVFHWGFKRVSKEFQGSFKSVSRKIEGWFKCKWVQIVFEISSEGIHGSFKGVHGSFKGVSRKIYECLWKFQGYLKEVY